MFQQTSGTVYPAKNRAGSVCICSAWSRAGKRGEGCGLRCHPNFSKVFPSSAPLQGITQSLTGCLMPGGEGMAFGLCVLLVLAAVSGPGLTNGCAVHGHLCDKSRAGPQQRRGERANVSHILPPRVRSQPATSAHRLSPQPSCFWGSRRGLKDVFPRWATSYQIGTKMGHISSVLLRSCIPEPLSLPAAWGLCARQKGRAQRSELQLPWGDAEHSPEHLWSRG